MIYSAYVGIYISVQPGGGGKSWLILRMQALESPEMYVGLSNWTRRSSIDLGDGAQPEVFRIQSQHVRR